LIHIGEECFILRYFLDVYLHATNVFFFVQVSTSIDFQNVRLVHHSLKD